MSYFTSCTTSTSNKFEVIAIDTGTIDQTKMLSHGRGVNNTLSYDQQKTLLIFNGLLKFLEFHLGKHGISNQNSTQINEEFVR